MKSISLILLVACASVSAIAQAGVPTETLEQHAAARHAKTAVEAKAAGIEAKGALTEEQIAARLSSSKRRNVNLQGKLVFKAHNAQEASKFASSALAKNLKISTVTKGAK